LTRIRVFIAVVITALIYSSGILAGAGAERSDIEAVVREYLANHPEEIERIVKEYFVKNPAVLQQGLVEVLKRQRDENDAKMADKSAIIKKNASVLFSSSRQVTLGNLEGDVTLVEFFDYNCGYCKRALGDMLEIIKDDPKVKIVLKEMPILGPGSAEAAQVAIAVRMQDAGGQKYLAFHKKLLIDRGRADKASAMAAAEEAGLDMSRLAMDLASDEVRETLKESRDLAIALGITGTPSYVVGQTVVPGAIGAAGLKDRIKAVRQ
jgi:protein-disulfide isomerase